MDYQKLFFLTLAIILVNISNLDAQRKRLRINGRDFVHRQRNSQPPQNNRFNRHDEFRTYDGTNNNLVNASTWAYGATDIPLMRTMDAEYGSLDEFNALGGENRPSPRVVSNTLINQDVSIPNSFDLSSLVFTWGQFLDHDIDLTPESHVEFEPIEVAANDPTFTVDIPFFRSEIHDGTGVTNTRQQTNLITSWIDASNVYGSDETRANWLRTFSDGKMKTSQGDLLPYNTLSGEKSGAIDPNAPSMAGDGGGTLITFVAGDVRAPEQPGLTSLHTLFVREHNRICDQLKQRGVRDDEQIYQMARKQVGALVQAITFNEFLPALGIRLPQYRGYQSSVQPDISNMFATAAYRLGHTMVTEEILLLDDDCAKVDGGTLSLFQGFFNTSVLETYGIETILKGLSAQQQEEIDLKIVDNLRELLFGPGAGLDLASLNIQRGRDHGLPDYNTVRKKYTGRSARRFSDITDNQDLAADLESVYQDLNDIDLWVGLLSEDKERNALLGPTLTAILADQFTRLRDGDFYYYQNDPFIDSRQLNDIRSSTLGRIINRNTSLSSIPTIAFFAKQCGVSTRAASASEQEDIATSTEILLEAFPNPTSDNFRLRMDTGLDESVSIKIYDLSGKLMKTQKLASTNQEISIENLMDGIYYLKVIQGEWNQTIKLVKN